jgi:hypothetical protein
MYIGEGDDKELCDAIPRLHHEFLVTIGVQEQDPDLSAVPAVDQTRGIDERDPMVCRQPRPREHQTGEAWRKSKGQTRTN